MRMRWLIVLALAGVALVGGGTGSGATTPGCSDSGPLVCVDLVGTPATVPPSDDDASLRLLRLAYLQRREPIGDARDRRRRPLRRPGARLGHHERRDCSVAGQPTCVLGRLASGASATVEFVAQAPEAEGTAKASLAVSFDERANDGPAADPKQDTVVVSEDTKVAVLDGTAASFVPKGSSLTLTTDPTGTGVATAPTR